MKKDSLRPLIRRSGVSLHEGRRSERNKVHGRAEAVAASMTGDGPLPRPMSGYVGMRERRGHGTDAGRTNSYLVEMPPDVRARRGRGTDGRPCLREGGGSAFRKEAAGKGAPADRKAEGVICGERKRARPEPRPVRKGRRGIRLWPDRPGRPGLPPASSGSDPRP